MAALCDICEINSWVYEVWLNGRLRDLACEECVDDCIEELARYCRTDEYAIKGPAPYDMTLSPEQMKGGPSDK